jgi:hypothetical protein
MVQKFLLAAWLLVQLSKGSFLMHVFLVSNADVHWVSAASTAVWLDPVDGAQEMEANSVSTETHQKDGKGG